MIKAPIDLIISRLDNQSMDALKRQRKGFHVLGGSFIAENAQI